MDNFQELILNNDYGGLSKLLDFKNQEKNIYDRLCEIYEECRVKGVTLEDEILSFMTGYIVRYRLFYTPPDSSETLSDNKGRIVLLLKVLDEYPNFEFPTLDEKVLFIHFIVKLLNVLQYDKTLQQLPLTQIHFMLCIQIAVNTDRSHTQYEFIDQYFQFLIDEKYMWGQLTLLNSNLKDYLKDGNIIKRDWNEVISLFKMTKNYYLLQKIWYNLHLVWDIQHEEYRTNCMEFNRCIQLLAECFLQMKVLKYTSNEDDTSEIDNLMNNLVQIRDNMCHANLITDRDIQLIPSTLIHNKLLIDILKIFMYCAKCIPNEKRLIERHFLGQLLKETNLEKVKKRINAIDNNLINKWADWIGKGFSKAKQFANLIISFINNADEEFGNENLTIKRKAKSLLDRLQHFESAFDINYCQYDFVDIIIKFKNICESNIDNIHKWIEHYRYVLVVDYKDLKEKFVGKILNDLWSFSSLLPESTNQTILNELTADFHLLNQTHSFNLKVNSDSDIIIDKFIKKIETLFEKESDRQLFKDQVKTMKLKQDLLEKYKLTHNFSDIENNWPKTKKKVNENEIKRYLDPLKSIINNFNKNLQYHIIVEKFLNNFKNINEKSIKIVVDKIKLERKTELEKELKRIFSEINKSGESFIEKDVFKLCTMEMYYLECIEVLKLLGKDIRKNRNYLESECSMPVGTNLRNYIAHGDIYIELFHPDMFWIVLWQNDFLTMEEIEGTQSFGLCCDDDFDKSYEIFVKHRSWVRSNNEMFNWNFDENVIEKFIPDPLAFKSRDTQNLSIVHYNLRNLNKYNPFLMYLIEKLTDTNHNEINFEYEMMLENSKSINYQKNTTIHTDLSDLYAINLFIHDLINASDQFSQRQILSQILCLGCSDLDLIKQVFINKPNEDPSYNNLLILATANSQIDVIKFLLEETFYKDRVVDNLYGQTALQLAIYLNKTEVVKQLLQYDTNSLAYCKNNKNLDTNNYNLKSISSPLILSIVHGDLNMFKLFHNLNIHLPNLIEIDTTLNLSIIHNINLEMTKLLIEKYPELVHIKHERTPIQTACVLGRLDAIELLIENGAILDDWTESKGLSCIHYACEGEKNLSVIQFLIDNGAPLEFGENMSPLMMACLKGHSEVVKLLLKNKANAKHVLKSGFGPLCFAIQSKSVECVEELLKTGAVLTGKALSYGIKSPKFFKYLLSKCPKIEEIDVNLMGALSTGCEVPKSLLNYIKSSKIPLQKNHFIHPILSHNKKALQILFEYPYLNLSESDWNELLTGLVIVNDFEMFKILLKKFLELKIAIDQTVLYKACDDNDKNELVKLLLNAGANVNGFLQDGSTPLMEAADSGADRIVQTLLDANANVDLRLFETGEDALELAIKNKHLKVVKLFPKLRLKNSEYLFLALETGDEEIVNYILDLNQLPQ